MASLLAGGVTNAQIARKLNTLDTEGRVNGFWNSVFNNFFTSNNLQWSLNPEERNSADARADILIHKNTFDGAGALTSRPCVVFEGKGANSQDNFKNIENQLKAFLTPVTFPKIGSGKTHYYCVGAKGTLVSFWQLEIKNSGDRNLYAMNYDGNNNFKMVGPVTGTSNPPIAYDLTNLQERAIIVRALTHIRFSF